MYLMLLFLSSSEIGLDTADVDSFDKTATIDVYSSICVNSFDSDWTLCRFVHFWLTSAFVSVEDDEYLITG
jgi:hypothetical protein